MASDYSRTPEAVSLHVSFEQKLEQDLKVNPDSHPFDEIMYCNIRNPRFLGWSTSNHLFQRVLALCDYPTILDKAETRGLFSFPSQNHGIKGLHDTICAGIEARDGFPADPNDIFLTDGARPCIQMMMQLLIRSKNDGILCPIPQYTLYSAYTSVFLYVSYYLDEATRWSLEMSELKNQLDTARSKFTRRNVYALDKQFHSFKKVVRLMGYGERDLALVSFHSVSKGIATVENVENVELHGSHRLWS
ncbi:hypothetical protein OROMI_017012 [Orobanche minor]